MKTIISLVCAVLLASCATVGVDQVQNIAPGSKIVTLSLLGNTLPIEYVGTTVFQNNDKKLDIPDWMIDKTTESRAASLIRERQRQHLTVIEAETSSFRENIGTLTQEVVSGSAIKLAGATGADYVLVLIPTKSFETNGLHQSFLGYGIYEKSWFGTEWGYDCVTIYALLLNGKNGSEVAHTRSGVFSRRADNYWMDSENLSLSQENAKYTRSNIELLIKKLLTQELEDLKII